MLDTLHFMRAPKVIGRASCDRLQPCGWIAALLQSLHGCSMYIGIVWRLAWRASLAHASGSAAHQAVSGTLRASVSDAKASRASKAIRRKLQADSMAAIPSNRYSLHKLAHAGAD
jgi:hypothetical protein